jgi:hypothetical protein
MSPSKRRVTGKTSILARFKKSPVIRNSAKVIENKQLIHCGLGKTAISSIRNAQRLLKRKYLVD